ncbi:MAG TPA: HlyD family efflux transporter periplasmic adaptor subunit [Anaerolineae bacterium]
MNWKQIIAGLLIIALVVVAAFFVYQQSLAPEPEIEESTVDVNTIAVNTGVDVVSAEGIVVPLRHAELSFEVGGQVAEILVEEGDRVEVGTTLLRLEATELEIALREAESTLAQAEAGLQMAQIQLQMAQARRATAEIGVDTATAQLALVQADARPEEIAAAESRLAAANAGVSQAVANRDVALDIPASQVRLAEADLAAAAANEHTLQNTYDDILESCVQTPQGEVCPLLGPVEEETRFRLRAAEANLEAAEAALDELNEGASPAQRRAANAAIIVATAQRNAAQAQLDLLLTGPKPEQVLEAEVGIQQAQAAVQQAEAAVLQAEATVAQAQAAVTKAETAGAAAQAALDRMTLVATFAGTVADLPVRIGQVVSSATPVIILADFSNWMVETADLTELDVVSVAVGYPVDVSVDAIPGEVIQGTVTDIDIASTLARGDVTYVVSIRLDQDDASDLPLRWGMTAFVDVDVSQ